MAPELREHWMGESHEEGFEVWPDNWRALQLFWFCGTQWQFSESGQRWSLNYAAVVAVLNTHRIPPRQHARLMADIRLIEYGALEALAKKAEQSSNGA